MKANAETTGICAGLEPGKASWLTAEEDRAWFGSVARSYCSAADPPFCGAPATLIFAWPSLKRPRPSGGNPAKPHPQSGLVAGRVLPDAALYAGTGARFIRYEGLEHYLAARDQGKGVLILTGHLGAWELSSFYHSLMGYPMSIVIRRLDNPLVDNLVNQIRCLHGNQVLHKDDFARGLLGAMRRGETVGILMDTNMTPPQGAFVDFFGHAACTGSGLARVAMKTGAKVLPGFLLWDDATQQYVLRFGAGLDLPAGDDAEADALAHTALFTRVIESTFANIQTSGFGCIGVGRHVRKARLPSTLDACPSLSVNWLTSSVQKSIASLRA